MRLVNYGIPAFPSCHMHDMRAPDQEPDGPTPCSRDGARPALRHGAACDMVLPGQLQPAPAGPHRPHLPHTGTGAVREAPC